MNQDEGSWELNDFFFFLSLLLTKGMLLSQDSKSQSRLSKRSLEPLLKNNQT